jgi:hypothetical protein
MKKFNQYEMWLIVEGLKFVADDIKRSIQNVEDFSRVPITKEYVDMTIDTLAEKVRSLTSKK